LGGGGGGGVVRTRRARVFRGIKTGEVKNARWYIIIIIA